MTLHMPDTPSGPAPSELEQHRGASVPAPGAVRARRPRTGGVRGSRWAPYGFLLPAIVLFLAFLALPIGYSLYLSLRQVKVSGLGLGSGSRKEVWVGLDNYASALGDPEFLSSVRRVAGYGLIVVPTMLGLALLFALLLDSRRARAQSFSRLAIFLPYAVPAVISSLLWGFLYLPAVSPFHDLADSLGASLPNVLSARWIVFAIANIAVWGGVGFNMIVIYTSLKTIPTELYEAARLDGCNEVQIAWRIKVPLVVPSLIMTAVFSLIATLQVFAEPVTLRPLTNTLSSTWSPLMKVYRDAFTRDDVYSAAATSVVLAAATFILSFGFLRLVQSRAFNQERS